MKICIFYTSPKLGDLILQLPFIKAIANKNKVKITLCVNKHIAIKNILEKQDYIEDVIENPFRRGKYFVLDIFNLISKLRTKKFHQVYILEKTKGAAIASVLAGIKNIYGFGIGSQKFFVNKSIRLKKNDLKYNYTEQSIRFLSKLNIKYNFDQKFLTLDKNFRDDLKDKYNNLEKPWACFGVDSTEINRIWPQKHFAELADKLIEKNLAKTIFVINAQDYENYYQNITDNSKNSEKFVDCKNLNRSEIIKIVDLCQYFVGIDSGPSCVAGALKKKTFCIIGPTDATLPRFSSINKIVSDVYDEKREVGIKRCGDNFIQNDHEVKRITVKKVYDIILEKL